MEQSVDCCDFYIFKNYAAMARMQPASSFTSELVAAGIVKNANALSRACKRKELAASRLSTNFMIYHY